MKNIEQIFPEFRLKKLFAKHKSYPSTNLLTVNTQSYIYDVWEYIFTPIDITTANTIIYEHAIPLEPILCLKDQFRSFPIVHAII